MRQQLEHQSMLRVENPPETSTIFLHQLMKNRGRAVQMDAVLSFRRRWCRWHKPKRLSVLPNQHVGWDWG